MHMVGLSPLGSKHRTAAFWQALKGDGRPNMGKRILLVMKRRSQPILGEGVASTGEHGLSGGLDQ